MWRISTLFVVLLAALARAHWPSSADSNLVICDSTGEQVLPKAVRTSSGGCYVCWQDQRTRNYDLYLQLLDADGRIMWQHRGLLVSSHPQATWITDYDMAVDQSDCAIIAINDIRNGEDRDIYAYRISPDGISQWDPNGVIISANDGFEPDPRVVVTSGGNIVFAWQEEVGSGNVIHLRKLTPAGQDVWSPASITLSSAPYGLSIPRISAAEGDAVLLSYLVHRSSGLYAVRHLFAQKFDSLGVPLWSDTGVVISNQGAISAWAKPDVRHDGAGGAYVFWYDTRDNGTRHHVWVQHVSGNGVPQWTANGVRTSMAADELQMDPTLVKVPGSERVLVFYAATNLNQSTFGIQGQAISSSGQLLWGNNGVTFVPLSTQQRFNILAEPQNDGAIVTYLQSLAQGSLQQTVEAFRVSEAGDLVWPQSFRVLCSVQSTKRRMATTVNRFGQVIAVWPDERVDPNSDLYLQNINPDGTLGDLAPPSEPHITILLPDSLVIDSLPLMIPFVVEDFLVAPSGGDGVIEVRRNEDIVAWHDLLTPVEISNLPPGTHEFALELVLYDHAPLTPRVADSVVVMFQPDAVKSARFASPGGFSLSPAYPNPFNPQTTLRFTLSRIQEVRLEVYDLTGRRVALLVNGSTDAGTHQVNWICPTCAGGIYFASLSNGRQTAVTKMLLLR